MLQLQDLRRIRDQPYRRPQELHIGCAHERVIHGHCASSWGETESTGTTGNEVPEFCLLSSYSIEEARRMTTEAAWLLPKDPVPSEYCAQVVEQ